MVEDDPLGRQAVEVGRLDPGIAVGTQEAQVQAVADDDDDVHGAHCSRGHPEIQTRDDYRLSRSLKKGATRGYWRVLV